jgi:hypothetical protein
MVRVREHREGSVHTLPEDDDSSTESTRSVHTKVEHLDDEYDLDLLSYPSGFFPITRFSPRHGNMVLNVSNDEPTVMGETNVQWQPREQRNTDHPECRRLEAEEEERRRGPRPRDLANAFNRVGERQVFWTPSANVAIAMANWTAYLINQKPAGPR